MSEETGQDVGFPVNPDLVWDYEIPPHEDQTEAFRRWYIGRVLTRGRAEDIRAIGLNIIAAYLPELTLPPEIRRFWEWYLNLPEVRGHNVRSDPSAA
ncbi:MAG: hypothetical protein QW658_01380 [Candidatus Bathyarchaeia archaeon]